MLSANNDAPCSVEELHDMHDFYHMVSRDKLEDLAGSFWEQSVALMRQLLDRNGLGKGQKLAAIEVRD